jgi:hypothetical protein
MAQQRNPPDGEPLGHENVSVLEEDSIVRANELARREFRARLLPA